MLHELSLGANSMAISYWQDRNRPVYTNIFSFGKRILPEYTCDIGLSNSMARPMKLRCCVFNKVFLVNHWHDILNCSCKWLCFSNSYSRICSKP